MNVIEIGKSSLIVPRLCLGCWAFAGGAEWGEQEESQSRQTIHAALDVGLNFFDTAPGYGDGRSEEILGRALKGHRDEAVIATKIPADKMDAQSVVRSCEDSLRRLQTDRVDLLQIHWPSREISISETVQAMQLLVKQGKAVHLGVSNFGLRDLQEVVSTGVKIISNQLPYSLLSRQIEFEVLPICRELGVAVLPYSPLMQGLLTGKYSAPDEVPEGRSRTRHFSSNRPLARHGESGCEPETFQAIARIRSISRSLGAPMAEVALAWLLAQEGVTSVVVGARSPEQIRQNICAFDLQLTQSDLDALAHATQVVKERLGANPDLWSPESRFR